MNEWQGVVFKAGVVGERIRFLQFKALPPAIFNVPVFTTTCNKFLEGLVSP